MLQNLIFSTIILTTIYIFYKITISREQVKHVYYKQNIKCHPSFEKNRLVRCSKDDDCTHCNKLCVTVSDTKPYSYNRNNSSLNVPNGKWCLTPHPKSLPCNPKSGQPTLTHDVDTNDFTWRCQCKYPQIVRNAGVYGDCSEVVACGGGKLTCPPNSLDCKPGTEWKNDKSWSPIKGVCKCKDGKKFIQSANNEKLCKPDSCFPGKSTVDDDFCDCPDGKKTKNGWVSYLSYKTKCTPDPCNPHGFWNGIKCVCDAPSIDYLEGLSPVQHVCKSPCSAENNPCNKKGTCWINSSGIAKCKNCKYPFYQDKTNTCNNVVKHGNVECKHHYECETRSCATYNSPLFKMGNGRKYCSRW